MPPRRAELERRLRAFLVVLVGSVALHDLLPYVGLRDDSCQTMFCGLEWRADENNHWFMPQRALADSWSYLTDVEVEISPAPDAHGRRLLGWLVQPERQLNTEATRVVVDQLCDAGHQVAMRYRRVGEVALHSTPDACREPTLSAPRSIVPVRLYETDFPYSPRDDRPLE